MNHLESSLPLLCSPVNIETVLSEVVPQIDESSTKLLQAWNLYEKVIAYMCEAYMANQPTSLCHALLVCCSLEAFVRLHQAAELTDQMGLSEIDLVGLTQIVRPFVTT